MMKQLFYIVLILQINLVTAKESEPTHSKTNARVLASSSDGNKLQTEFDLGNEKQFNLLVERICLKLIDVRNDDSYPAGIEIENLLLQFNNWTRETTAYKNKLEEFWKVNQNHFICPKIGHFQEKHILKTIIDMQVYNPILDRFFLKKSNGYMLDMNAFELVGGKPETVVDYLEKIINGDFEQNYEIVEIKNLLRKLKKHFNAKSSKELNEQGNS